MSTSTVQVNIIYGIGEGAEVANTTMLAYALRWANSGYRNIFLRYRLKNLRTRTVFRTTDGQQTYQAPSGFSGFCMLKDESAVNPLEQITPEEFQRKVDTTQVTDESFTSVSDTAVSLDNTGILQYSETVTTTAGTTTYTRDTDYTMNYTAGTITMDSTGSMVTATAYYIDYLYYKEGEPEEFCLEYDATNARYIFRLRPTPDDTYIYSLIHSDFPSDLSSSVAPLWDKLEYALERGGIYFGSLEIKDSRDPNISRHKGDYEEAIQSLIQLDQDLIPKHDRIKVVMRKSDY